MVTRKEILHRYPFLRLIIPLVLGIVTGLFEFDLFQIPFAVIALLFLILCFIPLSMRKLFSFKYRWVAGILFFLFLFSMSFETSRREFHRKQNHFRLDFPSGQQLYIGDIIEPPVQKPKSSKIILKLIARKEKGEWKNHEENILVYISKDIRSEGLFYGDRLLFRCRMTEPLESVIPGSFDNKKHLSHKGIFLQAMINREQWVKVGNNYQNGLFRLAMKWRNDLLDLLRNLDLGMREFAIASAMLLGYVDEVESGVMKDYSATGVIHILSVSGMHVGMIFLALEKLLGFLKRWKSGQIVKVILTLLLIWGYAMITGLSPAVLRASVMLTLIIIGNNLSGYPDTLNILAASFFMLLVWDPKLLMDMGFQLSYLAMAGIIILNQPVYNLLSISNTILDKVWSLISVSVTAQLATVPLCLYYFHQFPNYFLVANLIVVPLSSLVIYIGIVLLFCSGIPVLSVVLAKLSYGSIWLLNEFIHFAGTLPGAVTKGITISLFEVVLLFGLLTAFVLYFSSKKKKWLFVSLGIIVLFQGSILLSGIDRYRSRYFFIHDFGKSLMFECSGRGSSILAGDIRVLENPYFIESVRRCQQATGAKEKFRFLVIPGMNNTHSFKDPGVFFKKGNYFQFYEKRIGIVHEKIPQGNSLKIKLDFLIISGNPRLKLSDILRVYNVKTIIFDKSNMQWRTKEWIKEAGAMKVPFHSIPDFGPFVEDF